MVNLRDCVLLDLRAVAQILAIRLTATWETLSTQLVSPLWLINIIRWADFAIPLLRSVSYKHLQHQVTGLASVLLNLQSSHAYGRVVSDPIEGAPYDERPLLVLRNAAGA